MSGGLEVVRGDAAQLAAALHLLADAAGRRGDEDVRGFALLLARHAEGIVSALEGAATESEARR